MKVSRSFLTQFLLIATVLGGTSAQAQLRIGTFDTTRGGAVNFGVGSLQPTLRSQIIASFPGVSFLTSTTLTPAFLENVDVLLLASARGDADAIDPLTGAEQTALFNFVLSGKGAVLFPDNETF